MKYYIIALTHFIFIQSIFAQIVPKDYAIQIAENFYNSNPHKKNNNASVVSIVQDIDNKLGEPYFYAINFSDTGFVLVSGEFGTEPILAYSYSSFFTGTELPFSLQGLMQEYRELINHIQTYEQDLSTKNIQLWNNIAENSHFKQKDFKPTIQPILPCDWDQGSFYNHLCPEDPNGPQGHVYAGCVATAMGMVMYHYRYPKQGRYNKGYYSDYGYLHVNFDQSNYNWNNMPHKLASANYDVAKLLYDLGISVEMMYSPEGSGAYMDDAANAMKTYFKYNPNLSLKYRHNYTLNNWIQALKNQLNQNMPIIYAGYENSGGGHAFVCDGYDAQDYFHFNWGWSGLYNGYYKIDYLTPGGYSFSSWQMAIFDVYPDDINYPYTCESTTQIVTSSSGSISDGGGHKNYENNQYCSWLISPETATEKIIANFIHLKTQDGVDEICIYDGEDENAPLLGCCSGNSIPKQNIISSGDKMFISFITDETITDSGFHLSFTTQKLKFCENFQILTAPNGEIEDGSNKHNYQDNTLCRWFIKPENAGAITLWFDEFDIEENADYLILFDPSVYPSKEIKRFSGSKTPEPYTHYGSGLVLLFTSDNFNAKSGWKLHYTSWATSIDEPNLSNLTIYPNPFNEFITVDFPKEIFQIEILDLSGQIIYKNIDEAKEIQSYQLFDLPKGVYFIKIITDSALYVSKHIKL